MRKSLMVDSGAFTIFNKYNSKYRTGKYELDFSFYKTKEFWDYVDSYAAFIKKWENKFDTYVNVDACLNPKISWRIQKYLENEHGLNPIPVIHFGTDIKWVHKYLDAGYKYIGLGGKIGRKPYQPWADRMWSVVCRQQSNLPLVKVHGFAQTKVQIMVRYPWYSVDSVTTKKMAYYGQVMVPSKIGGKFSWRSRFLTVFMDSISPYSKGHSPGVGRHWKHLKRYERKVVRDWFRLNQIKLGKRDEDGNIIRLGITNSVQERVAANIKFFLWLQSQMPEWPWPWRRPLMKPHLLDLYK